MPDEAWGEPRAEADGLTVWLRAPTDPPPRIGAGTAIFVHGAAIHRGGGRVRRIELAAGGEPVAAMAAGMPSPTLATELRSPSAGRAIFWGIVAPAAPAGGSELELIARLEGGGSARVGLGPAAVAEPEPPAGDRSGSGQSVAICMATYEPPAELLERQLESLRTQTHSDWVCVISDDASSEEAYARLERLVGSDPRFVVSRASERAGAYANFARALAMVPPEVEHVALSDQDDRWHPNKLETLLGALGDARLVFSDMRLTTTEGGVISDTYWTSRVPNHESYASLLLGNSVTGAATLFRRELLDLALPLPPRVGNLYHDHWLALVAASTGRIAYVDRPLYDYVQHPEAVIGHAGANRDVVGGGVVQRLAALRGRPPGRLRAEWRRIYFAEYCRMALTAVALEQRLGASLDPGKRRVLERALALDRSAFADGWLAARQLRRLVRDDTGGSETGLLRGLAWRHGLRLRAGRDALDDADLPPGIVGVDPSPATRVLR
jgi:glycosyltransferase involved in cell wall biosynthesis